MWNKRFPRTSSYLAGIKPGALQFSSFAQRWWSLLQRNPPAAVRSLGLKSVSRIIGRAALIFPTGILTAAVIIASIRSAAFPPAWSRVVVVTAILLAAVSLVVLYFLPRSVWSMAEPFFGFVSILVFAPAAAFFGWYAYVAGTVGGDFYSTAGQVLPVFVLAVLVDMKVSGRTSRSQLILFVLMIAAGEFSSLFALAFENGNNFRQFGLVCGSFVGGFVGLTMSIVPKQVHR